MPAADAELRRLLQKQIDALDGKEGANLPERVRSVLRTAILTGHGAMEDVAPMFSMHSRSLHRRLAEFDVTFKALADETRFEIARQMLEDSATPISQIAEALDYADASAFTPRLPAMDEDDAGGLASGCQCAKGRAALAPCGRRANPTRSAPCAILTNGKQILPHPPTRDCMPPNRKRRGGMEEDRPIPDFGSFQYVESTIASRAEH